MRRARNARGSSHVLKISSAGGQPVCACLRQLIVAYILATFVLGSALIVLRHSESRGAPSPGGIPGNAAWIDHHWVSTVPTQNAIGSLCLQLTSHRIVSVYAHVGPADASGHISAARSPYAARFVASMHATCPAVTVIAWIGQLLPSWDGMVDLRSSAVRTGLAQAATRFCRAGFDGVQYDLEPVASGDPAFLALLRQSRASMPGCLLAVAGPAIQPSPAAKQLFHLHLPLPPWSASYYAQVAVLTGEVDAMLYDTGLKRPGDYAEFVADQIRALAQAARGVAVRPGLPAFAGRDSFFDDRVENLRSGLAGVAAVRDRLSNRQMPGIAVYPLWSVDASGWAAIDAQQTSQPN